MEMETAGPTPDGPDLKLYTEFKVAIFKGLQK